MARKKRSSSRKKKKRISMPFKNVFANKGVLIFAVCAVLLAGIIYGLGYFFLNSSFFNIKEISVNKERGYSFTEGKAKLNDLYLGHNIFRVDLKQVERFVKDRYPHLKKVEVRRMFPDQIEVDIVPRQSVAYISAGYNVVIDKEGIILGKSDDVKNLVEIKGINFFFTPKRGEKIKDKRVASALDLLDGLNKNLSRVYRNFEFIDISDKRNLILGIDGMTVKMGSSDFTGKVRKLRQILSDPDIDLKDINYIDLRFDDAVISPK